MLEKLLTSKGESAILIIILVSGIIVFMLLPITASFVERGLIEVVYQNIADSLEIELYQMYHHIDLQNLSHKNMIVHDRLLEQLNQRLKILVSNTQLEFIELKEISYNNSNHVMTFTVDVILNPSTYRHKYLLNQIHTMRYRILIPIDG